MSIHEEIAADAVEIFAAFGKEIRLPGRLLQALISEPQETLELDAGGFTASGNFNVKVLRSQLAAIPKNGQTLNYAGETFRLSGLSW